MKFKALLSAAACILIFSAQIVGASTVVNFDASGDLYNSVFGFDITTLDNERSGDFNASFTSGGGAIPDSVTANWLDVSVGAIVSWFDAASPGMPLETGLLGTFNEPPVSLSNFVLSDAIGDPTLVLGTNFWVFYDLPSDTYTITGTNVPIPSTIFLLGGGFAAIGALRLRYRRSKL